MKPAQFFIPPHQLIDELGIEEPGEIKIEAIAQHVGATVIYDKLVGSEARLIGSGDRAIITVGEGQRARQRFSIAHEIGHWMRDRGQTAFTCADAQFWKEWTTENPERRANRYAAELLLPKKIFSAKAANREVTFQTASELATIFESSLTATALRLVELGSFPSMIVCSEEGKRLWFVRGRNVPENVWPVERVQSGSLAAKINSGESPKSPSWVDSDQWINHSNAGEYTLIEDSRAMRAGGALVLSLLWWKNEKQIVDLTREAERSEYSSRGWR